MSSLAVGSNVTALRQRIQSACARAGREPGCVTLIGASKRQPNERLVAAYDAGLRCFGENRVQEALAKGDSLPADIDWHLIGPLQSNKASRAAGFFSTMHSIDRLKIARSLSHHAGEQQRHLRGFLQVNVGLEDSKHGFAPDALRDRATLDILVALPNLEICGLMAIPPIARNAEEARHWFRALRALRDELQASHPKITNLSMGMSSDFEIAIEEGATHIRLGSILFGERHS